MSPAPPCQQDGRMRRGGRVVEGARLERVYTGNRIKGSNPFLSAKHRRLPHKLSNYIFYYQLDSRSPVN